MDIDDANVADISTGGATCSNSGIDDNNKFHASTLGPSPAQAQPMILGLGESPPTPPTLPTPPRISPQYRCRFKAA
eukprot:10525472-Alexandrium_andersonii.AAC.1